MDARARLAAASREVVRRRPAQRRRQLPRPSRPHRAAQQGRAGLGGRAGRSPHAHLLRPAPRRLPLRQRPEIARRAQGRSRRVVHAAHPRARHRHARVRAARRRPQRRLRRFQRDGSARSDQRLRLLDPRDRGRRLSARAIRSAQANGRRSARGHTVDPPRGRGLPRRRRAGCGDERGPRPLVPRPHAGREPGVHARADGRRGHALHPLHLRYDRQTQGHRPHDRRLSHRRVRDDEMGLRPARRRRVLVHGGYRLGHRAQLRRVRTARERRDRRDVRRRARLAAERSLLGHHRAPRRHDLLHGAHRDSCVHALGHRVAGEARSLEPAPARIGRRADQSRGVDVVPRAHRPRTLSDRRHVVADRNRDDSDHRRFLVSTRSNRDRRRGRFRASSRRFARRAVSA